MKVKILKIQKQIFAQKDKELSKAEYERLLDAAKAKGNEKLYLLMQTICSSVNTTRIYTMETGEIHRKQIQKLRLLRL